MSSRTAALLIFFLLFTGLMAGVHLPYLKMPYFWDELGQFVPAALDIFQLGAWIPKTTLPNVHPPGVMAYLALVWKIFGYSILATRLAMLLVASAGVLFSFLLAIRLSRGTVGAPAFAAVVFLMASPLFYTQSIMAQLDMPAMTLTALALLIFLEDRVLLCALVCTALVLVKETGITTPLVLAAWLWLRDGRRREALYFVAPAVALGGWLLALHHGTGHWLGNAAFAQYNVADSLHPGRVVLNVARRVYTLFVSDGLFLGSVALFVGSRVLRGREWTIAFLVGGAQILMVSLFGGAALERYALPVFPILFAAMAAAASTYPASWRWMTQALMTVALLGGLFWNPPHPFPYENNLAMTDFVELQRQAAAYLEAWAPHKRIASTWPFTDAVRRPEFGYVTHPLNITGVEDFSLTSLANLDRRSVDVLVVFSREWPIEGGMLDFELVRSYLRRYWGGAAPATPEQIQAGLGFVRISRLTQRGQFIEVYVPER